MSYTKPYKGLTVVDMSQAIAGPYAGSMLARLGADVIKIEPYGGDLSRGIGKKYEGDQTIVSLLVNLGKKSICIDLKSKDGPGVLRRILESADVFIENFRPGISKRLGFSYEEVSKINPRIIYLSISGFGQRGDFAERPGTDGIMQAFSGFMASNKGFDGLPHRSTLLIVDFAAALYNVQAIQAALWARHNEETGCHLENSLLETAASFQNINIATQALQPKKGQPLAYPTATFESKDGFVVATVLFDREFQPFIKALGLDELADDPRLQTASLRYENRELIDQPMADAAAKLSSEELCKRFTEIRLLHERINTYEEFMHHKQTEQMGAFLWYEYPGVGKIPLAQVPGTERLGQDPNLLQAPKLGEHTTMVLSDLGYSQGDIDQLEKDGAINTKLATQVTG